MFTDKLFTSQRNMTDLGIYHYGARFYSPKLGRFLSADTIVPNPLNPQDLNRFAYVRNNPLRYTDPSGHMMTEGCGDEGKNACHASDLEATINAQKLATLEQESNDRKCEGGDSRYCSGWANGIGRPITGTHAGFTFTNDVFYGKYYYEQTDKLVDWKTGTIYTTKTIGDGTYFGTLNVGALDGHVGNTFVFGIPLSATPEEVRDSLGGPNSDNAFDVGIDIVPDILGVNSGAGFSRDVTDNGQPITTSAGPMFSFETKVGAGMSIIPFPVDGGIEHGNSTTRVVSTYQIPWWPFK